MEHFATEDEPVHFLESGLDNVYLVGIKYFTAGGGRFVAEIPALKQLMRVIAWDIVLSKAGLTGGRGAVSAQAAGQESYGVLQVSWVEPEVEVVS